MLDAFVMRAVSLIHEEYDQPLRLNELARVAMMSKFHFLRTFQDTTGVTPARFLSAVRIHHAKRLLRTTPTNVADISVQVGYNSVGSFTRRFTESVSLSPRQYRRGCSGEGVVDFGGYGDAAARLQAGSISGDVRVDGRHVSPIYLAVFRTRIPEGVPGGCTVIEGTGGFRLPTVPPGMWYVLAVTAGTPPGSLPAPHTEPQLLVGTVGPVRVRPGASVRIDVTVTPLSWTNPPVLLALPGLDLPRAAACQAAMRELTASWESAAA